MVKVKASELSGGALDWAVAQCEDEEVEIVDGSTWTWLRPEIDRDMFIRYAPSSDWEQGGPIIERKFIATFSVETRPFKGEWAAECHRHQQLREIDELGYLGYSFGEDVMRGSTPLIAAMRCYVASKLGEMVKVPTELIGGGSE